MKWSVWARRNCPRTWQPVHRVSRAMERISRNRWLDGEEAWQIAFDLAKHCSRTPHHTAGAVICDCRRVVGIIRGMPPFTPHERQYADLLELVKRRNKLKNPELHLCNLI